MIAIIELLAVIIVYKDILFEDDNVIDACNLAFFKEPSETTCVLYALERELLLFSPTG